MMKRDMMFPTMDHGKRHLCLTVLSALLFIQLVWLLLLCTDQDAIRSIPCSSCNEPVEKDENSHDLSLYSSNDILQNKSSLPIDSRAVDEAFLQLVGPSDPRRVIFQAKYNLVWIDIPKDLKSGKDGLYEGVKCSFCPVAWKRQKAEPHTVPRYHNAFGSHSKCSKKNPLTEMTYDLADIVKMTRRYDALHKEKVRHLPTAGFVFHESRAGSTLVANMLTVANPETNRVYSEPDVLKQAMKTNNTHLVNDVLYMLGRTRSETEERVFYKIKSDGVRYMDPLPKDVPWIFLYRDPNQVLSSHFHPTEHNKTGTVICLLERKKVNPITRDIAQAFGLGEPEKTSNETICALRLASFCDSAIRQYEQRPSKGRFVNYNTLPESLWESIAPDHFGLELSTEEIARMKNISGVYSKGRTNKTKEWDEDEGIESKTNLMTPELRQAADTVLLPFYKHMESLSKQKSKKRFWQ